MKTSVVTDIIPTLNESLTLLLNYGQVIDVLHLLAGLKYHVCWNLLKKRNNRPRNKNKNLIISL